MRREGHYLIYIGLLFIAIALLLTAYNVYDGFRAKVSAHQSLDWLKQQVSSNNEAPIIPNMEMPVKNKDGIDYIGILEIPAMNLALPIISELTDSNLKISPCRYSGSAYKENLIIASHNYASHFGHFKNLHNGDIAIFTDIDGHQFIYKMCLKEILLPTEVEKLRDEKWHLTLFTCTLDGEKRVAVRFENLKMINKKILG